MARPSPTRPLAALPRWRHVWPALLGGLWLASAAAPAQTPQNAGLSLDDAWGRVVAYSDKLAAAQAAVRHKALQREGIEGLGRPSVALHGASFAYSANLDVSLDPVHQKLAQIQGQLPVPLENLPVSVPIPQLPAMYSYHRQSTGSTASVSAVWPLWDGGAATATRALVGFQGDEASADQRHTRDELMTQLGQRYFGAQLAQRAAQLRQTALHNVAQHDAAAQRMLDNGVLARVERLQVRAAFEDAQRNARKAQDDAELAQVALARTVHWPQAVQAQTPLFMYRNPVGALEYFVQNALQRHPGLDKVQSRMAQAQALHAAQEALTGPTVFAFGQHALQERNPDWVAGVGLRWTLYDGLDHRKLSAASQQQVAQAQATEAQARSDIALAVERQWKLVEQARRQYWSLQASTELAQELLHLRRAGLREGTGTALELMDAETNAAKVQTESAQAAYEFDLALAALLEVCALSEEYPQYAARADIHLE
ncbi:MAG: TolC family protein [Rhodoferax sp.]